MSSVNSATRRGEEAMTLSVSMRMPFKFSPSRSAILEIMVIMQEAKAPASKSVGENRRPKPPLSGGKSVWMVAPVGPWRSSVCPSPKYVHVIFVIYVSYVDITQCSCLFRSRQEENNYYNKTKEILYAKTLPKLRYAAE